MSDAPERIWLQDDGDYPSAHEAGFGTESGVTWCDTSVNDRDTEYVRADILEAEKEAAVAAEREACAQTCEELRGLGFVDNSTTGPVPMGKTIAELLRARNNTDALTARDALGDDT